MEQDQQILKGYIGYILPLPEKEAEVFCALFEEVEIGKNEHFAREGKTETQLGFLLQGVMRAYHMREGAEYNKNFFTPYNFVCAYTSMISEQPNRIPVQALTDCKLLVADYRKVKALFDEYPLIERMARLIAEYLYVNREQRELDIIMLDATERYAILLQQYPDIEQQVSQYHIASYLGITATQLSRIRARQYKGA